jgi:hypothetical protein
MKWRKQKVNKELIKASILQELAFLVFYDNFNLPFRSQGVSLKVVAWEN